MNKVHCHARCSQIITRTRTIDRAMSLKHLALEWRLHDQNVHYIMARSTVPTFPKFLHFEQNLFKFEHQYSEKVTFFLTCLKKISLSTIRSWMKVFSSGNTTEALVTQTKALVKQTKVNERFYNKIFGVQLVYTIVSFFWRGGNLWR